MKKPWEQEWKAHDDGRDWRIKSGERDVFGPGYDATDEDFALATAAPGMARALMGMLTDMGIIDDGPHFPTCQRTVSTSYDCNPHCATARSALRKAGVIP